jgi:hypothetical protein
MRRAPSTASCSTLTSVIAAALVDRGRGHKIPARPAVRDGVALGLDDGAIVCVAGKPEQLIEIAAASAQELAQLAWHCLSPRHDRESLLGRHSAGAVERALAAALDDVGSAAFRADLASMHHETQYTRLFRS